MSNNDFLGNKKYSVCTLAKEYVLCTKMFFFYLFCTICALNNQNSMYILIFTIFSGLSITITLMHRFIFQKNNVDLVDWLVLGLTAL